MECQKDKNLTTCPCTYPPTPKASARLRPGCPRKGICCECIRHHRESNELPACYFSPEVEATYDRSISNFIQNQKTPTL